MKISSPLGNKSVEITSKFGPRWGRQHKGVDIKADVGTRVTSVLPGKVVKSGNFNDGYGGQVLIIHNTPEGIFYSRYAHLRKMYVKQGETVNAGEKIGESGGEKGDPNAGRSTGPHLHFEIMDKGQRDIDPVPFLSGAGTLAAAAMASSDKTDGEEEQQKAGSKTKIKTITEKSSLVCPQTSLTGD
jgi:murein DD-endopeptidase MepM/ murein hydrolase activator NlpD